MALTKPILYTQPAFDATEEHIFTFNVIGGDQVVANQLTIINQQTSDVVYQEKQETYVFTHILPADTLTNGGYYSAYINTYNSSDDESATSSSIQFYCFTKPSFEFSNIPSGNIINNSMFNFEVTYTQTQGERLESYSITLYDDERTQISTSGVKYVTDQTLPITIEHMFSGFENSQTYYLRAVGTTVNQMTVDTGYVVIFVSYQHHGTYADISLYNNCNGGYVTVQSNLLNIEGISEPSPPKYILLDNKLQVDATRNGDYIKWNKNFDIPENFTASLWGQSFNDNSQIIEFNADENNNIKISYIKASDDTYYLDMAITEDGEVSHIYSDQEYVWAYFNKQQIWLRRVDDNYILELHNLTPTPPSRSAVLGSCVLGWMILGEDEVV